jgi:hypothetical protein
MRHFLDTDAQQNAGLAMMARAAFAAHVAGVMGMLGAIRSRLPVGAWGLRRFLMVRRGRWRGGRIILREGSCC